MDVIYDQRKPLAPWGLRIANKLRGSTSVMLTWMIWIKPFSTLLMPIINLISQNNGEKVKEHPLMGQCGIYTNKIFYPKIISGMEDTEVLAITMYQIPILRYSAILFLVGYGKESTS